MVFQINKTIKHYFPDLKKRLSEIPDVRKRTDYEISEIIMAGICLFLFKEGSRNAFNLDRKEQSFSIKYKQIFNMRLPHMDTVDDVFRLLNSNELETLKADFVRLLIKNKVFQKFKFFPNQYLIAIDGTGVVSFDYQHCENCLSKKYEKKTVYFHPVLEAKMVFSNGLSISIASEWISNPTGKYDKQDCELKAFKRLSTNLKTMFPKLNICLLADGLYPNITFFNICKTNNWDFIITFKDGNLPSVWEEINLLPPKSSELLNIKNVSKSEIINKNYRWRNKIEYENHKISWIQCDCQIKNIKSKSTVNKKSVFICSTECSKKNAIAIVDGGRMRWKIENEGFNEQKNGDYKMEHKYSRVSFNALKNYYLCLQIAHIINQLSVLSIEINEILKLDSKITVKYLWKRLISFMIESEFTLNDIKELDIGKCQIRLVSSR